MLISQSNNIVFLFSSAQAINAKKLTEETIRSRVKPLFYTRMRLGEFDPPEMVPYTKYNMTEIESEAHRKLSVEAAVKSFVLLKSEPLFSLPLKVSKNIAVSVHFILLFV